MGVQFRLCIHVQTSYWVCLQVDENTAGVCLYDSMYSLIFKSTVDSIIELVDPLSQKISIKSMVMQVQKGSSDCGLFHFAVAIATALCYKLDPTVCHWVQEDVRPHLAHCLTAGKINPFPADKDMPNQRGHIKECHVQGVHCVCQRRHKSMKQCRRCQG